MLITAQTETMYASYSINRSILKQCNLTALFLEHNQNLPSSKHHSAVHLKMQRTNKTQSIKSDVS
jgi:hypothetical protein